MSDDSWPPFLDLLDKDRNKAIEEFYHYARRVLTSYQPRCMRGLSDEDRKDVFHDIVYHCIRNDLRVLRRYVDKGISFAAWLYVTASNKCWDIVKRRIPPSKLIPIHGPGNKGGLEDVLGDKRANSGRKIEFADLYKKAKKYIFQLKEYCQLLLLMAEEGLKPREMVKILGLPPDQNVKISNDLGFCRRKLKALLIQKGIL
ncbi:MAG: sigma-70 family RNA polymerase sigma factor [bacterium]|nr:MAG: sigma-70 family RNA polymerase sigma factor [bacterium]